MRWQIMNGEKVNICQDRWIDGIYLKEPVNGEQVVPQKESEIIDKDGA